MVWFSVKEIPGEKFQWYGRIPTKKWRILREFIFNRDNGLCKYCGNPIEINSFHCHHALELSEGGTNHPSNLKSLCKECHKQRHPFMKSLKEIYNL